MAEISRQDEALHHGLLIAFPHVENPPPAVEQNSDGNTYFTFFDDAPRVLSDEMIVPKKVLIYWDASASREGDHQREMELLRRWFAQFQDRTMDVDLIPFRDALDKTQSFTIRNGNGEALLTAIGALDYDGATRLSLASPQNGNADLYFLFSDGLNTLEDDQPANGFNRPLYVVSDAVSAAHHVLRFQSAQSGGAYFNLTRMGMEDVLPRIGRIGMTLLGVACEPGDVKDVVPGLPVPALGPMPVCGKLIGKSADITLRYGLAGKTMVTRSFRIQKNDGFSGDVLRPYWAQRQLDEWLLQPEKHKEAIRDLGRTHGLVTPETSLIVLENLNQYVRHQIRPPASLPEMRTQYDARSAEKAREKSRSQEKRIEAVLALWQKRVAWWEETFPREKIAECHTPPAADTKQDEWVLNRNSSVEMDIPTFSRRSTARRREENADPGRRSVLDRFEFNDQALEYPAFLRRNPEPAGSETPLKDMASFEREAPSSIRIKPWNPDTPYLTPLENAGAENRYAAYLQQRKAYGKAPGFYLDCADFFLRHGEPDRALRVLYNISELDLENGPLLRVLAHRLRQWGRLDDSIGVFEQTLKLRGEEPQSYRDLALVLSDRALIRLSENQGDPAGGKDLSRAIALLYHVVVTPWDRFREIALTALLELNRLLPMARKFGVRHIEVGSRLILPMDLALRIVLTWDADLTDIDLWVTEPSGEQATFKHRRTTLGGLLSKDFTDGYGPEEYLLRRAMEGTYIIEANYYGAVAPSLTGPVTVEADIFTNYATPTEKRETLTVRLENRRDTCKVGEVWSSTCLPRNMPLLAPPCPFRTG